MKRLLAISAGVLTLALMPLGVSAHNAGHLFLPDGTCVELGSNREAPLVGNDKDPLDLIPATPRDEYGVSFVGVSKDTPIFPGACPAPAPAADSGQP